MSDAAKTTARLARGVLVYGIALFGVKALSLLLLPLYTRFLLPADYAIVSLAATVGAFCAGPFGLGLDAGMQRVFPSRAEHDQRAYAGSVLRVAALAALAFMALALTCGPRLLGWLAPGFTVAFHPYLSLALAATAMTQVLQVWLTFLQIKEQRARFAAYSVAQALASIASVLVLVVGLRRAALGMLQGNALAVACVLVAAAVAARDLLRAPWDWSGIRDTLRVGLPLAWHPVVSVGLAFADRFILERFRNENEVGIYSLAYTIGYGMHLVTSAFAQGWTPIFYDIHRDGASGRVLAARMSHAIAVLLTTAAVWGTLAALLFIRLLIAPRYSDAAMVTPWVIGGYLLRGWSYLLMISTVQGRRAGIIPIASAAGLAVNIGLNVWWVPAYGMHGAAWATLVGYGVELGVLWLAARAIGYLPLAGRSALLLFGTFGVLLTASQLSMRWWLLVFAFLVACGALVAIGGRDLRQLWIQIRATRR